MKRLLYILLLATVSINAQQTYYGKRKDSFVHAVIYKDKAIIDYSWYSKSDGRFTILDTLEFREGRYGKGKYSIKYEDGQYIFTRGQIVLSPIITGDSSLYPERLFGYRKTQQKLNKIRFEWIGDKNLQAISRLQKINSMPANTLPEEGYRTIDSETRIFSDSVKAFCSRFDSIKITDNRFIARKKYLNSSDPMVVSGIWHLLTESRIENRKIVWFYLAQGIAITVTLAAFNPEYIYLVAPGAIIFAYGLYAIENLVAERFVSNKTFIVSFLKEGNRIVKVKIRNDYILNSFNYKYRLKEPLVRNLNQQYSSSENRIGI
jgi:hypothetical protein